MSSSSNPGPVFDFSQLVERKSYPGYVLDSKAMAVDGRAHILRSELDFIRYSDLEEYWDERTIEAALRALAPEANVSVESIQKNYLVMFSILVITNQLGCLTHVLSLDMTNDKLPLPQSQHRRQTLIAYKLYKSLVQEQWRFTPLVFESDRLIRRELDPHHILPIREQTLLFANDSCSVYRITIDEAYNKLSEKGPDGNRNRNTFVLKSYQEHSKDLYNNEVVAYTKLQEMKSNHIISYYGSFSQGNAYNLLLGYADGGSLLDFYKNHLPPRTPEELLAFWQSFSGYFEGAWHVHQIGSNLVYGLHGDIKPDNLLHEQASPASSPYHFTAKMADFGHSHFHSDSEKLVDRRGNQQYCAPEASHHTLFLNRGTHNITSSADIFALGGVLSDAVYWVAFGEEGRARYFAKRQNASQKIQGFVGSGYQGCFHDGVRCLPVVMEAHKEALQALQTHDKMTPRIIELIEDHMLLDDPVARWSAKKLRSKFDLEFQAAGKEMVSPSMAENVIAPETGNFTPWGSPTIQITPAGVQVGTTDGPQAESTILRATTHCGSYPPNWPRRSPSAIINPSSAFVVSTSSSSSYKRSPQLTLRELEEYRNARKSGHCVPQPLENAIADIRGHAYGRDHIFLIQNSQTMAEHKDIVISAFEKMAYLAKQMNTDGIRMGFTSASPHVMKTKATSKLSRILQGTAFDGQPDMMEHQLDQFVEDYIKPRLDWWLFLKKLAIFPRGKPLTLFVFTDGRWSENSNSSKAAGVQTPIQKLMQWMIKKNIPRTHVAITFVQFGDDMIGRRHLNFLDKCGRISEFLDASGRALPCDIVDTGHINGSIQKLFIGAITEQNDSDMSS